METGRTPGSGPPSGSRLPSPAPPRTPAGRYAGPVPPGGWDQPLPATPVLGELAGWWSRAGAAAIDALVIMVPAIAVALGAVALVAGPLGAITIEDEGSGLLVGVLAVLATLAVVVTVLFVTALLYACLTMRRPGPRNGQTWGKQLLGIRVIRMGGEPSTLLSAATREVAVKLILFGAGGSLLAWAPTILDLLWPLWDGQRRALHDMLVDTRVIRA